MRFPSRSRHAWAIALSLALFTLAPPRPARAQQPDSLPDLAPGSIYISGYDEVARATGLMPLRLVRLGAGEREVRIWTQVAIAIPMQLYRFVDRGGRVTGELIFYWPAAPTETTMGGRSGDVSHDMMMYILPGRCDRFAVAEDTGICRARFTRTPDWGRVLRAAESHGLWTIPDPSTLPPDGVRVLDGWSIVVELRDVHGYRAYSYANPGSHPKWPSAAQVTEVAKTLGAIDSLVAPSDVDRVYRGVTTGRYQSAFRSCESGAEWDFHSDLRALARNASPRVRALFPADSTGAAPSDSSLFYVEVLGSLTPEWLAQRWGSRFPRALRVLELRDVRAWTGVECRTR
jgi:hypothetical protein